MTTMTLTPRTRRMRRAAVTPLAIAALTAAGLPLGAGIAEAEERKTRPAAECLWAGKAFAPNATVIAGGSEYRCGTDRGAPYWVRGANTDRASTVSNPGARTAPADRFSPGARQPGTSYNDYCVGDQLIPGTDDIYQVVRLPEGITLWKAAAPISQWPFDSAAPESTWRTSSLCIDGTLT
ncbi:hypothetical protein [Nocardia jejuensis]|uniref:hypothetical protein n=1 Tax=Nocardia jejuensis TaxID=328049 RepID=UPI000829DAB8|nr:hypothetical protein [Nocardia jejuensis]